MATAYTEAVRNDATMKAARIMCTVCGGAAGFSIAAQGSTPTTLPSRRVKPRGWFIQAFAHTTKNADAVPAITMGRPVSRWRRGGSRSHA